MNNDLETQGGIVGDGDSRAPPALALQTQEHPVALAGASAVIRRFNKETMLVATGLLGTLIFATIMLAVQENHHKTPVLTDDASQTGGEPTLNANPPVLSKVVGLDAANTGEISSVPATNADEGLSPQISHPNAISWSSAHRQDLGRVIRPKNHRVKVHPSLWTKIANVFVFWHRKPVPPERFRGWAQVSKKGERQRVRFTAESNH
jgi:hypothetical protein